MDNQSGWLPGYEMQLKLPLETENHGRQEWKLELDNSRGADCHRNALKPLNLRSNCPPSNVGRTPLDLRPQSKVQPSPTHPCYLCRCPTSYFYEQIPQHGLVEANLSAPPNLGTRFPFGTSCSCRSMLGSKNNSRS